MFKSPIKTSFDVLPAVIPAEPKGEPDGLFPIGVPELVKLLPFGTIAKGRADV